jgi:hypothetical protein
MLHALLASKQAVWAASRHVFIAGKSSTLALNKPSTAHA